MSAIVDAGRFFDAIARRYDRVYQLDRQTSRARLERLLSELPAGARVLDLGVGTGRELSALLDAGHSPTGVDLSAEMLAICARRARPVRLVNGDFWAPLPFGSKAFDAAIALHGTLAHPPEEGALVRLEAELARVLVEGGVFVAEVPSRTWLQRLDGEPTADGLRVTRTAEGRCVHDDLVAGVAIEAFVPTEEAWRGIFHAWHSVRVEPLGEAELLLVARAVIDQRGQ